MNIFKLVGGPMDGTEIREANAIVGHEFTYMSGTRYDIYAMDSKKAVGEHDTEILYKHVKCIPITGGKPIVPRRLKDGETRCNKCGMIVIWTVTVNGKKMPVEQDDTENIILVGNRAHVVKKGEEVAGTRYISHFAKCKH